MNAQVVVCILTLFMGAASSIPGPSDRGNVRAREQLTGGWRLVSIEEDGSAGVRKTDCCGLFVFTRDGHASVQVMRKEAQGDGTTQDNPYSRGGYEATYGTYAVDARAHVFTLHVEGALAAALVGKDLARNYRFSGKQLIVTSTDPKEHWKVTWERY
jgi:hypothetical protein